MNITPCSSFGLRVLGLGALVFLTGCQVDSVSSRIKQNSSAYAAATPEQQKIIQDGWLDYGFTSEMVYISLGKPDRVTVAPDGTKIWIYMNFQASAPTAALGAPRIEVSQTRSNGSTGAVGAGDRIPAGGIDLRNRINITVRPDVGGTMPAEEIPELHVYFYNNRANNVKFKRGV
ncbi:MAG: hypothetical protein JWM32_52 [Verrucomicrobia bacterium]|nr:hypothetical protein [Verrucomicrobiota bacterium]